MKNYNISTNSIKGDRDYQDDYFDIKEYPDGSILLLLADGIGGYAGGRIASETVIETFKSTFNYKSENIKNELLRSLNVANDVLAQKKETEDKKYKQMGTTLIVVYMKDNYMQWISVGDSPLFMANKKDNIYEINRVNQNHSIAGLLELQYQHGEITKEDIENSPNKHMLTSAITGEKLKLIDSSDKYYLKDDDIIILATDGIETLSKEEIKNIINNSKTNSEITNNVISNINNKKIKNQDNTTLIVASYKKIVITHNKSKAISYKYLLRYSLYIITILILLLIYIKQSNTNLTIKQEANKTTKPDNNKTSKEADNNLSQNSKIDKIKYIIKKDEHNISKNDIIMDINEINTTKDDKLINKQDINYSKEDKNLSQKLEQNLSNQ